MIGASIETTRELWASSLREVKKRIRPLFAQERAALNAGLFVDGLLGDERRKTGWMRAEAAGDPGPWRQQAVLGRDRWDADALRDLVRDYATEHLADENAVLVIDETGFLKQGKASCGVARQYTGSAGKITNCQIGVFAAYVSRHGHAFIDRALYLPKGWTDDPARLKATYVPGDIGFSTKPQLAAEMIERALAAGVPFRWVAADSVYGVGDIERDLRQAGKGYVLGVNSNHWFASWGKPQWVVGTAEEIAKAQRRSDWRRLSAGAGTKGPRLHDWCYLELADLEGEESNHHSQVLWTRGLLIRRNIATGDFAYFTTWCPAGTSIKTLVSVEGHRWAIEDSFETAKNEFGLDHNQSRSWHGWHRHVSLVMLAFAMMAAIQHQANKPTPKKTKSSAMPRHPTSSVGRSGNPPHSSTSRAKTHSTRRCHRMVALAARSSGRSTEISSQTKITTVVLALFARRWDAVLLNEGNATMTDSIMFHEGNRELQDKFQSRRISDRLEEKLTRTTFTPADMTFIESIPYFFLATADASGRPDCSYKGGLPGFVRVTGPSELAFPDYDGNGMFKSSRQYSCQSQGGSSVYCHARQTAAAARERRGHRER